MTLRNKLIRDRNIKNAKVVGKNIMVLRKNISQSKRKEFYEEMRKDKTKKKL